MCAKLCFMYYFGHKQFRQRGSSSFARVHKQQYLARYNAPVTHTDTDSADATDGPSVSIRSIRNGPYRIRRVRNCPYRIRRVHRIRVQILKSFKIQARTSKLFWSITEANWRHSSAFIRIQSVSNPYLNLSFRGPPQVLDWYGFMRIITFSNG